LWPKEEQTTQWPKEAVQRDKQRSTKHSRKAKDQVTRTSPKTGSELMCSGRVSSSCSTSDTRRVNLVTNPDDKRDDSNFPIVNFPLICSNIPAVPAYGVYISQLIRYSRACGSYQDFLDRGLLLTRKLLNQWFRAPTPLVAPRRVNLIANPVISHEWGKDRVICDTDIPQRSTKSWLRP
jgi:hypothetical protein